MNNLILNGLCVWPGQTIGKVYYYNKINSNNTNSILIFNEPLEKSNISLSKVMKAKAIISTCHTSFSHLANLACSLNIPCIVGARFSRFPKNGNIYKINSYTKELSEFSNFSEIKSLDQKELIIKNYEIPKIIKKYNTLLQIFHPINFMNIKDDISGIFLDSNITKFNLNEQENLIQKIKEFKRLFPKKKIFYRFSNNKLEQSKLSFNEIDFVKRLVSKKIPLNVFLENLNSVNEFKIFNENIKKNFNLNSLVNFGIIIENTCIINKLPDLINQYSIDFLIIGINDLIAQILNVDRNNFNNQSEFNLNSKKVIEALDKVIRVSKNSQLTCYISYPKLENFKDDFKLLQKLGFENYFGTYPLLSLLK